QPLVFGAGPVQDRPDGGGPLRPLAAQGGAPVFHPLLLPAAGEEPEPGGHVEGGVGALAGLEGRAVDKVGPAPAAPDVKILVGVAGLRIAQGAVLGPGAAERVAAQGV